jgi:hypothetical protein
MIPELKKLSTEEMELIIKAPLLVSILIAGADGQIDRSEIKGAIDTTRKKAVKSTSSLQAYYESVSEDFEDKLKVLIQNYSTRADERGAQISEELQGLNNIFPKVHGTLSVEIYESLKSLALSIAKSSGGLFGLKSIGREEARYVDLKMIDPPPANR